MTCLYAWGLIGCSLIPARQKFCGLHIHTVSIRYHPGLYVSAAPQFHQSRQSMTSVFILTATSPWSLTSSQLYDCFAALCQIWSVRRSLMPQDLLTFFPVLVISKVDYCNSVLAGVSAHLLDRLQSVLNAAAWLIFSARKSECISPYSTTRHNTVIPCWQSTATLYCWCWRSPLSPICYR